MVMAMPTCGRHKVAHAASAASRISTVGGTRKSIEIRSDIQLVIARSAQRDVAISTRPPLHEIASLRSQRQERLLPPQILPADEPQMVAEMRAQFARPVTVCGVLPRRGRLHVRRFQV